jgi:hypothetical protein
LTSSAVAQYAAGDDDRKREVRLNRERQTGEADVPCGSCVSLL